MNKVLGLTFTLAQKSEPGHILKRFRSDEISAAIAEARAGGAPMTSEIPRLVVRSFRVPLSERDVDGLTPREMEILVLLAKGLSNKEIAQKINISAGTVGVHLEHIFKKLRVRSRTEAAASYFLKTRTE